MTLIRLSVIRERTGKRKARLYGMKWRETERERWEWDGVIDGEKRASWRDGPLLRGEWLQRVLCLVLWESKEVRNFKYNDTVSVLYWQIVLQKPSAACNNLTSITALQFAVTHWMYLSDTHLVMLMCWQFYIWCNVCLSSRVIIFCKSQDRQTCNISVTCQVCIWCHQINKKATAAQHSLWMEKWNLHYSTLLARAYIAIS